MSSTTLLEKIRRFIYNNWRKILFGLTVIIVTILLIKYLPKSQSSGINIPNIPNVPSSSSEVCTNCAFLNSMKDYSNLKCTPTETQLSVIKNMDPTRIEYCGNNICLPEMESLLISCFESINGRCSPCGFKSLISQNCMTNAYSNITDIYDNDKTRLQKRLFISDNCGCTPTLDQIDLMNTLVSNNLNNTESNYLLRCQEIGCSPETDKISNDCLLSTKTECEDCNFFNKIFTGCTEKDYSTEYSTEFERKEDFSKKCNCVPTSSQLNVLDNIKSEGITYEECANINMEPSQYCNSIKSLTSICLPSGILPTAAPSVEPTDPPDFQYPSNCENCDYIEKLKGDCVSNGLVAADIDNLTNKYAVTMSCGCTPTDTQLQVTQTILDNDKQLGECVTNNCEELNSISGGC